MKASLENPIYTVYIVSGRNKYNLSNVLLGISFSEQEKQLAKSAKISLTQIKVGSSWLSNVISVRDRVFVYADDGARNEEVYRGYVWTKTYRSRLDGYDLVLKCYDNLIYFQESEEHEYFSPGKSTQDIMNSLCSKWGISMEYSYESITHSKLAVRGTLSDIFTSDILDLVKDRTGKRYVILSDKDTMQVKPLGSNTTIYTIQRGKNGISTTSECSMDGMTTKVVILGKADDNDRQPVEASVDGDTAKYGTLQKLITRDENTSMADAKKEAESILDEEGSPKWTYEVKAPDIPWIRKGDKVKVVAGDMIGTYIAIGVDRDISMKEKTMTLTLENA